MSLQAPPPAVRWGGLRGERGRSSVDRQIERLLDQNPKLREALELAKISIEQYARALEALSNPAVYTAAGSNEGAGVLHGQLGPDRAGDR